MPRVPPVTRAVLPAVENRSVMRAPRAVGASQRPVSARNSARVRGSSRRPPCRAEVTVRAPGGAHPADAHAHVLGLEHDPHALGREVLLQPAGDLLGEPLLHLQPAGEQLDDARQLGQPEDPVARQVGDVRDADEGQQVVLAQRREGDVPGDDELVVALLVRERRQAERARLEQLGVRRRHPPRGVAQRLARDVLPERDEQVGDGCGGGCLVDDGRRVGERVTGASCPLPRRRP